MSQAKSSSRSGKFCGYIQQSYKESVCSLVTADKSSTHVKPLPETQRTSQSANSAASCSSLSYSIQNLSRRAQRQNQYQRSHTVSLYCYYYCLLLFLYSFIALYKMTNASSTFSAHLHAFFFLISTLPLRLFHPVPPLIIFFFPWRTVPSSSVRQRSRRDVSHSRNSPASVFIIFRASFLIFQHVLAARNHSLDLSSLFFFLASILFHVLMYFSPIHVGTRSRMEQLCIVYFAYS